jgi:hypothetical protein
VSEGGIFHDDVIFEKGAQEPSDVHHLFVQQPAAETKSALTRDWRP